MTRNIIGLLIGLTVGALCQLTGIPLPAPPAIVGAILVVATTLGYAAADRVKSARDDETGNPDP